MAQNNEFLTQVMNAIQEAEQTVQQAQASGNVQQMYEAQRVLYLAQQRVQQAETQLGGGDMVDVEQRFEQAQRQLDQVQQSINLEGMQ